MYNAIIVDDERIVLEGLQKTFKWEEYGFRICGLAENGEEL
jgi:two-component system response regulator YesN